MWFYDKRLQDTQTKRLKRQTITAVELKHLLPQHIQHRMQIKISPSFPTDIYTEAYLRVLMSTLYGAPLIVVTLSPSAGRTMNCSLNILQDTDQVKSTHFRYISAFIKKKKTTVYSRG